MRLHLLSPVPPAPTGTADYLRQLVDDLITARGPEVVSRLVLWDEVGPDHPGLMTRAGQLPVRPAAGLNAQAMAPGDLAVVFLAANTFHGWIWGALARGLPVPVIAVIHDLSTYPLIRSLARKRLYGLGPAEEKAALVDEHGAGTARLIAGFDDLPETGRYFILGLGLATRQASGLIVHSHYARLRLMTERIAGAPLSPVRVARHPAPFGPSPPPVPPREAGAPFTVGSVGFFNPTKRNHVLIDAFAAFLRGLPAEDQAATQLVFVGAIDAEQRRAAAARAADAGIGDRVTFTGYVDEETLTAWQQRLDLQVNLRFPSCGETSGTLARAQALGIPVVVSDFAAFREEAALAHLPVDPPEEFEALLAVIRARHADWRAGRPAPAPRRASTAPEPESFDAVLAAFERDLG
ncbi:glycosyltransferase [Phreatobacter sp.]|uniref:glycosyltransferase n=1 Tax=Phreatobacter sp. TaxID=1966341 RepID=UPI0022C158B8|nr:glycosyltransferase [Phreatobacter sp.]MCZ8316572.1 glycosyltransferase [Phreatobacter sp.]